jgi:hypothetical protein
MYVDDHMEIHKIKPKNGKKHNKEDITAQIKRIIRPIFEAQKKIGIESGEEKTVVLLELHGRGSQRVRKELGGCIIMEDGRKVKIVEQAKYLGVRIGGKTESNEQELDDRIKKGNAAMNRLTKIWRNTELNLEEKIRIYHTLVTTLLMYATETRIWSSAQLARLEAVQMRHLRRIAKSPAHLTLESNDGLRERTNTFSMASQIQARRLKLWQNVARNEVEEVVAAIWGKDEDEEQQMKKIEEDRDKQLLADVSKIMYENEIDPEQATTNEKKKSSWEKKHGN